MATTASEQETCFGCGEKGHIRRNLSQRRGKGRQRKTKPAGATKWCSVHFTTKHSDEECYEQGAKRPNISDSTDKAFSACTHCAHCSSTSDRKELTTAKEASSTKTAIDFSAERARRRVHVRHHSQRKESQGQC
ncbi:unnamed protein product [Ectocarpus sp. 8 AP-2014]